MKKKILGFVLLAAVAVAAMPVVSMDAKAAGTPVYRLFNPLNGDHMYTSSKEEYDIASNGIYEGEGVIYTASGEGSDVYRLYNELTGEHLYTADKNECNGLQTAGWAYEGVTFTTKGSTNVYRLFSPGALHLFTSNDNEISVLTKMGWTNEGVAWTVDTKDSKPDEPKSPQLPGVPNPVKAYKSLDEINKICNTKLEKPGVMGISDESFSVINGDTKIAQYEFKLNGMPFTFRSANTTKDISGYYANGDTVFANPTNDPIDYYTDKDAKLGRWLTIDGQFVLMVSDKGQMPLSQFETICEELRVQITPTVEPGVPLSQLEGSYQDSFSQRASLRATKEGDHLHIEVSWSSSVSEYTQWTMNARFYEDGLLSYTDCTSSTVTTDENGKSTEKINYSSGKGFFTYKDGKLLWDGADEKSCRECVFEKV